MNKNELRKSALLQRQQYSEEKCAQMSNEIADLFLDNSFFDLSKISYLHIFLPIQHKKEVDTFPIFTKVLSLFPQIKIVLSKCDFTDCSMTHFLYSKDMELKENAYGIPEPVSGTEINPGLLDMVLVPLVVVDQKGNRIGYGKGFYDRFLTACKPDCKKVGLSFENPVTLIPAEPFDIPLDFCITPEKIFTF
jgi:5-formyltetrahydrofolate cyclo-ligase